MPIQAKSVPIKVCGIDADHLPFLESGNAVKCDERHLQVSGIESPLVLEHALKFIAYGNEHNVSSPLSKVASKTRRLFSKSLAISRTSGLCNRLRKRP